MKYGMIVPVIACKTFALALLLSASINAEIKFINSVQCAEKVPAAKEIMAEGERLQKSKMGELKQIEEKGQKLMGEMTKDSTDLMAKRAAMSPSDQMKAEKNIKDKEAKLNEMQKDYQRIMQEAQSEMQMVQMRLEPFIVEEINNAQEVAKANPSIDAVWDEATSRFIYKKESASMNAEVIKLTEKKNEGKTALAKNKPAATKAPATKVA